MNWFNKYSQETAPGGQSDSSTGGTPGGVPGGEQGGDTRQVVMDNRLLGAELNKRIIEEIIEPLNKMPIKQLVKMRDSELGRFIIDLAGDAENLENFKNIVESYINNGVNESLINGDDEGFAKFNEWYGLMYQYTRNNSIGSVMDQIRSNISRNNGA